MVAAGAPRGDQEFPVGERSDQKQTHVQHMRGCSFAEIIMQVVIILAFFSMAQDFKRLKKENNKDLAQIKSNKNKQRIEPTSCS